MLRAQDQREDNSASAFLCCVEPATFQQLQPPTLSYFLCAVAFGISLHKQLSVSLSEVACTPQLPVARKHNHFLADLVRAHMKSRLSRRPQWTLCLTTWCHRLLDTSRHEQTCCVLSSVLCFKLKYMATVGVRRLEFFRSMKLQNGYRDLKNVTRCSNHSDFKFWTNYPFHENQCWIEFINTQRIRL